MITRDGNVVVLVFAAGIATYDLNALYRHWISAELRVYECKTRKDDTGH